MDYVIRMSLATSKMIFAGLDAARFDLHRIPYHVLEGWQHKLLDRINILRLHDDMDNIIKILTMALESVGDVLFRLHGGY